MRIITGKYKGRSIETVKSNQVRPATDRVKTTIFNMLQNRLGLNGVSVLDLFAGSGNLGFEALSRGAKKVVFVEDADEALEMIEKNAEDLNCIPDTEIIGGDAVTYLERGARSFELIFADPPYSYERTKEIPGLVFRKRWLGPKGYLIIEHSKHTTFDPSDLFAVDAVKEFGNTRVSFFVHPESIGDRK